METLEWWIINMKITYLTQQTWEQVREKDNTEPSLTRESDYVPIEQLFAHSKRAKSCPI